ncbi:MAG: aromatic amino acid lyase [Alphaproteobacteria bacterium]|nr:aromatic amino acid lyase [Alphaproteobacteria bacterium]
MSTLVLNGTSLTVDSLAEAATTDHPLSLDPASVTVMTKARRLIDRAIEDKIPVYGVTTGLGARAKEVLDAKTLADFSQQTLLGRAHAVGQPDRVEAIRASMIVRLNTLLKGYSGASPAVAQHLLACLNAGLTPVVGALGSIGAADLIRNATIGLCLTGQGQMQTADGQVGPAAKMMRDHGIEPLVLGPRDGLALANHSSCAAGAAALALAEAQIVFDAVQTAGALSMEGFRANLSPISDGVLGAKPLPGQTRAAADLHAKLKGSPLYQDGTARRLQDPISIRNIPQIHGTLAAALDVARITVEIELNGSSDNPITLLAEDRIVSGGAYFTAELTHVVEAISRAFVHVAVAQVARMSKHLNPVFSDLPTFLAKPESGSNGFAPVMKVAESLLSELQHAAQPVVLWPSINANGVEDCLTNSPTAVRALAQVIDNARMLTAIELIVAAQAVELRGTSDQMGPWLTESLARIRETSAPLTEDRPLAADIMALAARIANGDLQEGR